MSKVGTLPEDLWGGANYLIHSDFEAYSIAEGPLCEDVQIRNGRQLPDTAD